VLVYVGNAIFLHHLPDLVIIELLSRKNIHISASQIAYLGKKFIAYLTVAHRSSASRIKNAMSSKGGYILHLDTTYEENYKKNNRHKEMIKQINRYWEKLFADPIKVETAKGTKLIQPQRTNNLAERNFRDLKRGYRKKTGNGSLGKVLRSMLANTPLVKNLKNEEYMKILLNGKSNLEDLFAEIDAAEIRNELKVAQNTFEKTPAKFKKLVCQPNYPEILKERIIELESNGILC